MFRPYGGHMVSLGDGAHGVMVLTRGQHHEALIRADPSALYYKHHLTLSSRNYILLSFPCPFSFSYSFLFCPLFLSLFISISFIVLYVLYRAWMREREGERGRERESYNVFVYWKVPSGLIDFR